MTPTFFNYDRERKVTHAVSSFELSFGEQHIPNGFYTVARCGESARTMFLSFKEPVTCEFCKLFLKDSGE